MDADKKRQLKSEYKSSPARGAVYALVCDPTQHRIIKSTPNIVGIQNRFRFAQATKACPDPTFCKEWDAYGTEAFSLVVLEELQQGKEQTSAEFAEDIRTLHKLWLEKLAPSADE